MINWIKWKVVFTICSIIITYSAVRKWCKDNIIYSFAYCFRIYIIIDFILGCFTLPLKYNEEYMTNFYYLCIYLVFLVVVYFLLCKFIKAFREDRKNDT